MFCQQLVFANGENSGQSFGKNLKGIFTFGKKFLPTAKIFLKWSNGDSCKTLIRERYSLVKEFRSQQLEYHRKNEEKKDTYNNEQSKHK